MKKKKRKKEKRSTDSKAKTAAPKNFKGDFKLMRVEVDETCKGIKF